ncbi:diguanylate cyclase domain-containing protein [Marinobacter daqiaonensis]|uniref:diguanylate cyclase domain-containing protein n=1 Tax=Marinobacter daqiaonensis TaxID=650891 RepID=UPI001D11ECCA|nr:diguanylate cyclase [Marinobacter daqiaonensis]
MRWSDEEFLILLPDNDEKGAVAASEKLRKALTAHPVELGKAGPVNHTGSFGVAVSRLIARADKSPYMAKECGRNRIVLA